MSAINHIIKKNRVEEAPVTHNIDDLLEVSLALRATGADFPTIWTQVLQHDRLVIGKPRQLHDGVRPLLKIPLITGHSLVFAAGGFSIEGRERRAA
jgi:hypothetical protein